MCTVKVDTAILQLMGQHREQKGPTASWLNKVNYRCTCARMGPENTHKLMGFYTEVLILGVLL